MCLRLHALTPPGKRAMRGVTHIRRRDAPARHAAAQPLVAAGMTRIGDRVIVPWREHRNGTRVIGGWHPGTVVATRGHGKHGHAVVISYGYEHDHPLYEIRPYPTRRDGWPH